jgi:hypothetical protein
MSWNLLRQVGPDIPDAISLPRASGRGIASAWALGPGRPVDLKELLLLLIRA